MYLSITRINEVKWTEWKTHVAFINEDPGPTGNLTALYLWVHIFFKEKIYSNNLHKGFTRSEGD